MANKTLVCNVCQGEMVPYIGAKHSRGTGVVLMAAGTLSTLYFVGIVLGLPLFAIGLYMMSAKRNLWLCQDCNTAIERVRVKARGPEEPKANEKTQKPGKKVQGLADV